MVKSLWISIHCIIVSYRKSARCHSSESWNVILLLAERDFVQRITGFPEYAGMINFAQNLTFDGGTI